jgi:23S rRNA pseudouridine1911/1915/1917 synthase
MLQIKIIHEPSKKEPYIIIDKPAGLASAPLKEGELSALTQAVNLYPFIKEVEGLKNIEYGLLHRLDTATRGLLLIATNQNFYDYMFDCQKKGLFQKTYTAYCDKLSDVDIKEREGYPLINKKIDENKIISVSSAFRPFGKGNKEVRPVTQESNTAAKKKTNGILYTTNIKIKNINGTYKASCTITKGYRHQVRCHLAWQGFPVKGDFLYNPLAKEKDEFCFYATSLRFIDPISEKIICYDLKI